MKHARLVIGGYLINTNIISELRRRELEPKVVQWLENGRRSSSN